jgi:DHA1 family tetracycline resistance protein-like MFS transporter
MTNSTTLKFLYLTLLIDIISMSIVIPLLPAILTDAGSASYILPAYMHDYRFLVAGTVTFIFSFFQFIAAPLAGKISDKYGRRKVLLACFLFIVLHYFLFAYALWLGSVWVLIAARIVGGLGAANLGVIQAMLSDLTAPAERAKVFGTMGALFGIGFVFGPATGAGLAVLMPTFDIFLLIGTLCLINLANIYFNIRETIAELQHHLRISFLSNFRSMVGIVRLESISHLYAISVLAQLAFGFVTSYASFYFEDRLGFTTSIIGIYMAMIGLLIALYQGFAIRFILTKTTERRALLIALGLLVVALVLYANVSSFIHPFLIAIISVLGFSMMSVVLNAEVAKQAPAAMRGEVLGLSSALQTLSMSIPGVAAGALASTLSLTAPFYLGAILASLAFYFAFRKFHII